MRESLVADLTKAVDYAIVKLSINGKEAEARFDRYHAGGAHDRVALGVFDLTGGPNRLVVEIVGSNEKAVKKHMFGLDHLLLEEANP